MVYVYLNKNYIRLIEFDTLTCRNIISPITPGCSILIPKQLIYNAKYSNQLKLGLFPSQKYEEFIMENGAKMILGYIVGIELKNAIEVRAKNNIKNYNNQAENLSVLNKKEVIDNNKTSFTNSEEENLFNTEEEKIIWD